METYILLLLPVPKSIMICLFLGYHESQSAGRGNGGGLLDVPVEEHDRARVIQLVHLINIEGIFSFDRGRKKSSDTLVKSGT